MPDMVLDGEFGCLSDEDLVVQIQDADPGNGPVVDDCGIFVYEVSLADPAPILGFQEELSAAHWTVEQYGGATVSFAADGQSLSLHSGDGPFNGYPVFAGATLTFPSDGELQFDWTFDGSDPGLDFIGLLLDPAGSPVQDFSTNITGNGQLQLNVEAGSVLILMVDQYSELGGTGQAALQNFQFDPAALSSDDFTDCWGYINAEDKAEPDTRVPGGPNAGLRNPRGTNTFRDPG